MLINNKLITPVIKKQFWAHFKKNGLIQTYMDYNDFRTYSNRSPSLRNDGDVRETGMG